jgi:ribonuclease T
MARRFRGYLPVVVDVETGGFHAATDAYWRLRRSSSTSRPRASWCAARRTAFTCSPTTGARLDPAALVVNGIDPFHPLRPALPERDALQRVFREVRHALHAHGCTRAILVGHNAAFDLGFLNAVVARADLKRNPFHHFSCFDTATLAGAALGQTVLAKAVTVAGFSWDAGSAHSAAYDAERTADIFCYVCNRLRESFGEAHAQACTLGWI